MSVARRVDSEEFTKAQAAAREIRETVADQLHDLVIERDSMGSYDEVREKILNLSALGKRLSEARGREKQNRELGLPVAVPVRDQQELQSLLRALTMSLAAACGAWAAAQDFEPVRFELEQTARRGRGRRVAEEEEEHEGGDI